MKKVLTFSDVHFSVKNSEPLYHELKETLVDSFLVDNGEEIDLVCITGDYFHEKLELNSDASRYAIKFMNELADLCEKNNIPLRVLRGTLSHDFDQLDNFKHLELTHDFKIIKHLSDEEFANGLKVLYVPEEYITDHENYYKDYMEGNMYDFIFFHGTFDFVAFESQKQETERQIKTAPVLDSDLFMDHCSSLILGGHIHKHQKYKDKIYYNGSFSANAFDESDKYHGFMVSNTEGKVEYFFNLNVPTYKTHRPEDFDELSIEEKLDYIDSVLDTADNVRIKVSALDFETISDLMMFKTKASSYKKLKLMVEDTGKINVSNVGGDVIDSESLKEEKNDEFSFILDDELSLQEKLSKFIEKKHSVKISEEDILEFLTESMKENK